MTAKWFTRDFQVAHLLRQRPPSAIGQLAKCGLEFGTSGWCAASDDVHRCGRCVRSEQVDQRYDAVRQAVGKAARGEA